MDYVYFWDIKSKSMFLVNKNIVYLQRYLERGIIMGKMKLCKVCQKEVAKSAKICPHCGAKLKMGLSKIVGIGVGIIIVLAIIGSMSSNDSDTQSTSKSAASQSQASTKQANTQPVKKEEAKPTWNTTEIDAEKNGNVNIAVDLIKSNGNIKSIATTPNPADIIKAPWNYYGKVLKISGQIADIQEYPVGSDWSKGLGGKEAGQIVIESNDGTGIDMFIMGSTGNLKNDDNVTLYGYPVGVIDVDNKLGGKTTELVIVGNSFDK